MILSLALTAIFEDWEQEKFKWAHWARWGFLSAALMLFIYFFPILAALKIPAESFRDWMWFQSWI
jgi:dolichyl-phosphate-mannose--protein O-mannosyl transferase